LVAVLTLSACAIQPRAPEAPPPAPPTYDQLLQDGTQAQKAGNNVQAQSSWTAAARENPTAKEPWLHMAQMQFDAGNYGAAISAAQEAFQRDSSDATANGLLAVSGLRVSSAALARMDTNKLQGNARSEAESLAKTLRDLLGTPVLVPSPVAAASAPLRPVRTARSRSTAAAAKAVTTPSVQEPSHDPFSALR